MSRIIQIVSAVFIFTVLVVSSWILVHLLTIFGIFLAVAYPICWIIAPKQTICVFCRSQRDGHLCPLCHQVVRRSEGFAPKTFVSAVYNGLVLLAFTLLSIIIVFFESQLLFRFVQQPPEKKVSFSTPTAQTHQIGEVFPMQIKINGIKQAINEVSVDFSYNPSLLEVVDISTKDSFATLFIQKQIDNKAGITRFAGGLPNPGFSGSTGVFVTVYFRGLRQGIVSVHFLPSSTVLANNGQGDNLLSNFSDVSYLLVAKLPSKSIISEKKSLSIQSKVLGSSTSTGIQMTFYNDEPVLGAETKSPPKQQKATTDRQSMLSMLRSFDNFILAIWTKVF